MHGFRKLTLLALLGAFIGVILFAISKEYSGNGRTSSLDKGIRPRTSGKSPNLLSERKMRIKGLAGAEHPDYFAKYHMGIRTRYGESAPAYPVNYRIKELLRARSVSDAKALGKTSAAAPLNWVEHGPGNVGGRTRGLLVDPRDPTLNTWYAGSTGGGVWKTESAGKVWQELTTDLPNLATSTLAMSPANPDVIYAGTGEGFGFFAFIYGSGIWKTDDGGQVWGQLPATANNPQFRNIMRIIVNPADENVLLAVTAPGFRMTGERTASAIFRSEDGGFNWTKVYESPQNDIQQIVANPLNFNTQYATINRIGVIKSNDAGQAWFDISTGIDNTGGEAGVKRLELAIAPTDTSVLYLSSEVGGPGSRLYRSRDGGASWNLARESEGSPVNWLGSQGWYDNTIAVSPYNENEVFVGGINIWKITVEGTIDTVGFGVTGVDFENTESFLAFRDFTDQNVSSGISTGTAAAGDFTSIEIRFGPGKFQKAHRFVVPPGATSGVPAQSYTYVDYVQVPFEVWDIDHNQQLMVSFRDQTRNGAWELTLFNDASTREYLFPQAVPYSQAPSPSISVTGGHTVKQLYFIWPELAPSATWDPSNLPDATVRIQWGLQLEHRIDTRKVSNWFPGQSKPGGGVFPFVHADHHNLTLIPTDTLNGVFRILNGNDGGVELSTDNGITWTKTLNGYNTTQFYGVDKMNGGDRYIGGTQDNGSWVSPENPDAASSWVSAPSGDGFDAVWHYADANKLLESSQFNNIFRSVDGGVNWASGTNGLINLGRDSAPFFTKLAKSKQDPDLIFAIGASGVWRSDDFAANWTLTQMPAGFAGTSSFTDIKISLSNPQIVWAGGEMRRGRSPFVSTDGGLTFFATNEFTQLELGVSSGLDTHPTQDSTAYALFSFANAPKVLRTTDLGNTWEDISGFGTGSSSTNGFPDVAVYSLLVMPFNTNILWAGTEIGIFESLNNGQTWSFAENGFPAAAVYDMVIVNDQVVVATHGRGVWSVALPELQGFEPPEAVLAPRFNAIAGNTIIRADIALRSPYDSTLVFVNGVKTLFLDANATAIDTLVAVPVDVETLRLVDVSLASFKDGKKFSSAPTSVLVFPLNEVQNSYVADFNTGVSDLIFGGLLLGRPPGFDNGAVQSSHNYPDNATLTAFSPTPIRVASANAVLRYEDVAIVEAGRDNSEFGDPGFFDYVIVEGSNDLGFTWIPLADGYDARANPGWLSAYNERRPGTPDMYVTHELNLLDTFSPGDEILIRFRLFADAGLNAWGWAIDNVSIQENAVSVELSDNLPKVFSLSQNFPNPFNPSTQITYSLPQSARISLRIFNILGRQVRLLVNKEEKAAGVYKASWSGKDDLGSPVSSGVYFYRVEATTPSGSQRVFLQTRKMMLLK